VATAPLLERVLFGHVLTEREAQLLGTTAVGISLGFTVVGTAFHMGGAAGTLPVRIPLASSAIQIASTVLCVLLQRSGRVALTCLLLALSLPGTLVVTWYLHGGMAPHLIGFNAISVLVAGLLFGTCGAVAMGGLLALMTTWFLVVPQPVEPGLAAQLERAGAIYSAQLACLAGATGLSHLGYRRIQDALRLAEGRRLAIERHSRELGISRERFRLIAEHAHDLVSEYALDGRCLYLNEAARRFSGTDALSATRESALGQVHPDDRKLLRSLFEPVLRRARGEFVTVNRVFGADGAWHWMEARTVLFQPPNGAPRIVSVTRDVTEQKRAEEELERRVAERTQELEEAVERLRAEVEQRERIQESLHRAQHLASIGTLAAGIAHEINNPVGSILAAADEAQGLLADDAPRTEVEALLRKISLEATRCGRVVGSVLSLSRQTRSERWIGDLNEVVRSARDHLREFIGRSAARVELDLAEELPPIPMNPTELEQVVVNLVRNAIENGAPGVCVRIRTEGAPEGIRLRVLDDGPGIPASERGRIFDPFYTTRRSEGGAGLGLSLVHGIVAGHGGSIEVRGAPGAGTEFVLEFRPGEVQA
jgi:PAS domain S-box-containing protein